MAATKQRDYYTVAEAAEILEVSTVTVWRWIKAELLPAYRAGPKNIRIKKEDLEQVVRPVRPAAAEALAHSEEVSLVKELNPLPVAFTVRPLTDDEVQHAREALRAADTAIEAIRARRHGAPLSPSAPLIRQARVERSKQLQ